MGYSVTKQIDDIPPPVWREPKLIPLGSTHTEVEGTGTGTCMHYTLFHRVAGSERLKKAVYIEAHE